MTTDEPAIDPAPQSTVVAGIRHRLRRRASMLRRSGWIILALIAMALSGGIYLFVAADELSAQKVIEDLGEAAEKEKQAFLELQALIRKNAKDIESVLSGFGQSSDRNTMLTQRLDSLLRETTELVEQAAAVLSDRARVSRAIDGLENDEELRESLRGLIDDNQASVRGTLRHLEAWSSDLRVVTHNLRDFTAELKETPKKANAFLDRQIAKLDTPIDGEKMTTPILVQSVTTRVGAILILIFLVQILVSLYRYNTRLAAYYDGRADALEIYEEDPLLDLSALAAMLSPENIDFGRLPASPSEQALNLAKVVAGRK